MTVAWLKILHIAALSIWSAGLILLPGLIWYDTRRSPLERQIDASHPEAEKRGVHLRSFARACYLAILSPAAVVTIGSGMGLIFLRQAFAGWMFAKLAAVGGMVLIHMNGARAIRDLRNPDRPHRRLHASVLLMAALGLILAVLWLVLAKPFIDATLFPDWLRQPRPQHPSGQSSLDSMRPI